MDGSCAEAPEEPNRRANNMREILDRIFVIEIAWQECWSDPVQTPMLGLCLSIEI
jgi:hypothetical protein